MYNTDKKEVKKEASSTFGTMADLSTEVVSDLQTLYNKIETISKTFGFDNLLDENEDEPNDTCVQSSYKGHINRMLWKAKKVIKSCDVLLEEFK